MIMRREGIIHQDNRHKTDGRYIRIIILDAIRLHIIREFHIKRKFFLRLQALQFVCERLANLLLDARRLQQSALVRRN